MLQFRVLYVYAAHFPSAYAPGNVFCFPLCASDPPSPPQTLPTPTPTPALS